jgi:hypothetical protein
MFRPHDKPDGSFSELRIANYNTFDRHGLERLKGSDHGFRPSISQIKETLLRPPEKEEGREEKRAF